MSEVVPGSWTNAAYVHAADYACGFCENQVGSNHGYATGSNRDRCYIRLCPRCNRPTYFDETSESTRQYPGSLPGTPVGSIPGDLAALYEEARQSAAVGAYTGTVMLCRKMLMNIAVNEGSIAGLRFVEYIKYLEDNHYFSPKSKEFVTYIKDLGNEANHEIAPKTETEALAVIEFVRALLDHTYHLPSRVPKKRIAGG